MPSDELTRRLRDADYCRQQIARQPLDTVSGRMLAAGYADLLARHLRAVVNLEAKGEVKRGK